MAARHNKKQPKLAAVHNDTQLASSRLRAASGDNKAIMPTGPVSATAKPVKHTVTTIVIQRVKRMDIPKLMATSSDKRMIFKERVNHAPNGRQITKQKNIHQTASSGRALRLPTVQG